MRPEIELLLCCARTQLTPAQKGRIDRLVQDNLDWQYLLKTAQWHSLTPLLYWQLKAVCPKSVPPEIFSKLAADFTANLQRNFLLTAQLIKILKKFRERDIPAIPFKGAVLATTLYNNLALRRFYDLDILIESNSFFQAKQLLEHWGYQTDNRLDFRQQKLRLKTNHEQEFVCSDLKISVDLHWNIAPPFFSFHLPVEELFRKTTDLKIAGSEIPVFVPENLLIVLCVNGTKEGWSNLQRICDIAEFINTYPQVNWSKILKDAEESDCIDMVLLGINLARELLEVSLPKSAWIALQKNPKIQVFSEQVYDRLFSDRSFNFDRIQLAYFSLQLQKGVLNKLRYCFKIAITINERDLACISLPQWLFPLYYPIRFCRLMLKYGLTLKLRSGSD